MRPTSVLATVALGVAGLSVVTAVGQRGGAFRASRDHPAINYSKGPTQNAVASLDRQLQEGAVTLEFGGRSGYLTAVLQALDIPVESQVIVFSKTSRQAPIIDSKNPRAVFFNDSVAVGWVRDGDVLEVAAQDQRQGVVFYSMNQTATTRPRFERNDQCLACHLSWDTLAVPGLQVLSVAPLAPNAYATGFVTDHRSPLEERWGGWYVTGAHGSVAHMGNVEVTNVTNPEATVGVVPAELESLDGLFDLDGYPSMHSDIVALMVLNHQVHLTNLITRLGWEARRVQFRESAPETGGEEIVAEAAAELVDYMLFVDEAPLSGPVRGTSGFAEGFSARGPRDSEGRSLRELDLERWLFRYPCSYMIYTGAFDALPMLARDAFYERMWEVLSGRETGAVYGRLSLSDRQAIVEILRDTKSDLPSYFATVTR